MKQSNEPSLTELIRYAEMTWRNVQHSELLRNVLLSIYLTIGAGQPACTIGKGPCNVWFDYIGWTHQSAPLT